MSRNRRSHYPRRSVVDEETPAEDALDSLPEEKAQDIEEPEEKHASLCKRCAASVLELQDIKQAVNGKGWEFSVTRRGEVLKLDGVDAKIWYDDQPGVEPGWMFTYPDGDDEFIDSIRELEDALDILGSKWGKTACENCQRIRQAKSDWQFGSSLFRSRYKAVEAAIESWMNRSRDREVSRRELGELKDYVNQGVTKQTPGRGDGPSLAELRNGVDEAELKDILQDLGMRVSRRRQSNDERKACESCGRDIQAGVSKDYVERKLDEVDKDVRSMGRNKFEVSVGSTDVEVTFDGRRSKYDVKFDDGTSEVVVWPPGAPLTTKGHTGDRKKQQIAADAAKKVKVFRKAENYGWDVEILREEL